MVPRLELYWIPLGAGDGLGARLVRFSGGIYERLKAPIQRRSPQPLFHAALVAWTPTGRCVVEMTPVPRFGSAEERGVVGNGAVGSRLLGRARIFRYEIRRWSGGVIPDIAYAIDSPVLISSDAGEVAEVLGLLPEVPPNVWGRDEARTGDMWNSNSVVSWTLERAACADRAGRPPQQGRAPGWDAGVTIARRLPDHCERTSQDHSDARRCGTRRPRSSTVPPTSAATPPAWSTTTNDDGVCSGNERPV